VSILLAALEEITGASGVAPRVEALLPIGVRHRQLRVRTLLAGMMLTQADHRPAHLTRVRDALTTLPADDQARPGVTEDWTAGPHLLTYRQTERTFGLVLAAVQGERHRAGCVVAGERGFGDGSGCGRVVCDDTVSVSDKGRPSPLPFPEARGGP